MAGHRGGGSSGLCSYGVNRNWHNANIFQLGGGWLSGKTRKMAARCRRNPVGKNLTVHGDAGPMQVRSWAVMKTIGVAPQCRTGMLICNDHGEDYALAYCSTHGSVGMASGGHVCATTARAGGNRCRRSRGRGAPTGAPTASAVCVRRAGSTLAPGAPRAGHACQALHPASPARVIRRCGGVGLAPGGPLASIAGDAAIRAPHIEAQTRR
jgi:hypothetical protein